MARPATSALANVIIAPPRPPIEPPSGPGSIFSVIGSASGEASYMPTLSLGVAGADGSVVDEPLDRRWRPNGGTLQSAGQLARLTKQRRAVAGDYSEFVEALGIGKAGEDPRLAAARRLIYANGSLGSAKRRATLLGAIAKRLPAL